MPDILTNGAVDANGNPAVRGQVNRDEGGDPDALALARSRLFAAIPKLAFLGDSRCWYAHNVTNSITAQNNNGLALHIQMLTQGRVECPRSLNFGFAGLTTPELANLTCRQLAAASTGGTGYHDVAVNRGLDMNPAKVIAASEAEIVVLFVSTNDRRNNRTAIETIAALQLILSLLTGKIVIIVAETPRGDAATTSQGVTGSQLSYHLAVQRWIANLRMPNVFVVDPWPALADPASTAGYALSGMLRDGLHLTWLGNKTLAQLIGNVVNVVVPPVNRLAASSADIYDNAYNQRGALNLNPMLVGTGGTISGATGGTITGDVAANWTLDGSALNGVTIGATLVSVNGQPRQRLAVSGTPSGNGKIEFRRALSTQVLSQVLDGDTLRATGGIDVTGAGTGYTAAYLSVVGTAISGGTSVFESRAGTPDSTAHPSGPWGGFMSPELVDIPARAIVPGGDYQQIKLRYQIELIAGVAANFTIDLLPAALRKVIRQ